MRHFKKGRSFSRTGAHRLALLRNLSIAIINYEVIRTTIYKAKEVRGFLEKLITKTKIDSVQHRRLIFSKLMNKKAVDQLYRVIAPRFLVRPGGYLRILKIKERIGDCAPMALIGFVDKL